MYNKLKSNEVVRGIATAYRHKWIVTTLALAIVVLWQDIDPQMPAVFAENEVYVENVKPYEAADMELDAYIEKRTAEIFEHRQHIYKEMARQDALKQAASELLKLNSHSPHVDYQYMQKVVDEELNN